MPLNQFSAVFHLKNVRNDLQRLGQRSIALGPRDQYELLTLADNNRLKRMHKSVLFAPDGLKDDELVLQLTDFAPHPVHKVATYYFRMVDFGSREKLGVINLRVGCTPHIELYAGHVGYTVHPPHRGNRYAARALRVLIPVASELGLDPLWITCDPDNVGSRRSCEIAGADFVQIVDVPESCIIHRNGHKQKCRYRLDIAGIN